jgi:mannose-6-phosphate isomerase-like protein (cupin superfamily)
MQKHKHRSETWNLVSGTAHILTGAELPHTKQLILTPSTPVDIPAGTWHQGVNDSDEPAHIVEIWKGSSELLSEDDITRWT